MAITTITNAMVSVNAIQGTLIADNAITAVHIATNAVSGTLIADNAVTATHIAQNTITVTQLADDAVEADKIADGVITTNHLNKAMISSQTEVTAVGGDFVLIGDTSDSNNLKKALVSDFGETNRLPLAGGTMTGDLILNDSVKLEIGSASGGDLQIYHDGSDSYITDTGTGNLLIQYSDLYFSKDGGSTHSVVFRDSGKVGIGDTSPDAVLKINSTGGGSELAFKVADNSDNMVFEVQGGGRCHFNYGPVLIGSTTDIMHANMDDLQVGHTTGSKGITIASGSDSYGTLAFGDGSSGNEAYRGFVEYFHTDDEMRLGAAGSARMRILSDGEIVSGPAAIADTYAPLVNGVTSDAMVVGRHSTSGSLGLWRTNTMEFKYYHNGQGYIMTFGSNGVMSGDFNDTSDVNLKENISSISDGTTVIKALRPVKFDWKASGKGNNQHGFIAQEVETVLPDAVEGNNYVENETGLPEDEPAGNGKTMNSNAVLAHAVKAIQELEARIKVLEG